MLFERRISSADRDTHFHIRHVHDVSFAGRVERLMRKSKGKCLCEFFDSVLDGCHPIYNLLGPDV